MKNPRTQTGKWNSGARRGGVEGERGGGRSAVGSNAGRRENTARLSRQSAAGKCDGGDNTVHWNNRNGKRGAVACLDDCRVRRSGQFKISGRVSYNKSLERCAGQNFRIAHVLRRDDVGTLRWRQER